MLKIKPKRHFGKPFGVNLTFSLNSLHVIGAKSDENVYFDGWNSRSELNSVNSTT